MTTGLIGLGSVTTRDTLVYYCYVDGHEKDLKNTLTAYYVLGPVLDTLQILTFISHNSKV